MKLIKREYALLGVIALVVLGIVVGNISSSQKNNKPASYKNGTYTGSVNNAYYGNVQVKVDIKKGKITNVSYVQYPTTDATSIYIAKDVLPMLNKEVIKAQSSNVNVISGATYTSQAFIKSLSSALNKA